MLHPPSIVLKREEVRLSSKPSHTGQIAGRRGRLQSAWVDGVLMSLTEPLGRQRDRLGA